MCKLFSELPDTANVDATSRSDAVLFNFLEEYFKRLEGPIASQVWARYISLVKEVTSNVHAYKLQVFPVLR